MPESLHRRADDEQRGRHLVAARRIESGAVILVEKPLLCLQSLGNAHSGALTCRCCRCFVGGPDLALAVASGRVSREDAFDYWNSELRAVASGTNTCNGDNDRGISSSQAKSIVPCRNKCGELFCSDKCEQDMWVFGGHRLLCTGLIPELDDSNKDEANLNTNQHDGSEESYMESLHPLLQFKIHAVNSNEILLMVADMIASVVSTLCRRMEIEQQYQDRQYSASIDELPTLEAMMEPYLDFTLVPWWEVATAPLLSSPMGVAEASELDVALRSICRVSSALLKKAIVQLSCEENGALVKGEGNSFEKAPWQLKLDRAMDECETKYGMFSEQFFGEIIGSFEQNALGIRARHPLCRDIFDKDLRTRRHVDIIRCIEAAGMIGGDDCADGKCGSEQDSQLGENLQEVGREDEYEYTVDEIAGFIAGLDIDTDTGVHGNANTRWDDEINEKGGEEDEDNDNDDWEDSGDDLDTLFTPLDGTAMYQTTCKMNHSCSPNVVARYRYSSRSAAEGGQWGRNHPLYVECVALRDIDENEELTISYIMSNEPLAKRKKALANYGFTCKCVKCQFEEQGVMLSTQDNNSKVVAPFEGEDGDRAVDDPFGTDDESEAEPVDTCNREDSTSPSETGEALLQKRVAQLNKAAADAILGRVPVNVLALTSSFVIQTGRNALEDIPEVKEIIDAAALIDCIESVEQSLTTVIDAFKSRDLLTCSTAGNHGEVTSISLLYQNGSWPHTSLRASYWCFALAAAVAHADAGSFVRALQLLDKAAILGLPAANVQGLFDYVEYHSAASPSGRVYLQYGRVDDYRRNQNGECLVAEALSNPIAFPLRDVSEICRDSFEADFVSTSVPLVIRAFADSWPATRSWRNLDFWAMEYGHRLVPIELGDMKRGGMKESIMSFHTFVSSFLGPSTANGCWPLSKASATLSDDAKTRVAYMAQHPLFEQIPGLLNNVVPSPPLCGEPGPTHVNAWIGTGGTRTPLHFDSYDNLFVQLVGVKYVRIYGASETDKLYVIRKDDAQSSYGLQGNMSAVDCEIEDYDAHPRARDAKYVEALMFPGDCLYIPARAWHYVRSLTTSISVNFWF